MSKIDDSTLRGWQQEFSGRRGAYGQGSRFHDLLTECLARGERIRELEQSLEEMRNACAAACRVIALNSLADEYENELRAAQVVNGFGVRAQALLSKRAATEPR